MFRINIYCTFIVLGAAASSSPAGGTIQEFTVNEDWFDAVGGPGNVTTIDFDEFPINTTLTDHYSNIGVMWSGLNFVSLSNDADGQSLRMFNGNDIFFDEPIKYFGADIRGTVEYEIYSGDTLLHESQWFGVPTDEEFGGIVSDIPFDRIHVQSPSDNTAIFWDMHFGPPIPAPGALAPFALLFCASAKRRWRK